MDRSSYDKERVGSNSTDRAVIKSSKSIVSNKYSLKELDLKDIFHIIQITSLVSPL